MSNDIATSFLANLEGAYAAQVAEIASEKIAETTDVVKGKTIAARKAAHKKAIAELDVETIEATSARLANLTSTIVSVDDLTKALDVQAQGNLITMAVEAKAAKEVVDVLLELAKTITFAHLDATVGINENGEIKVPGTSKVLRREGAGQGDPEVDLNVLKDMLGEDAASVIVTTHVPEHTVVVPASTTTELNEQALYMLIQKDPSKMAALRAAITPGKTKTPKFMVRDAPKS